MDVAKVVILQRHIIGDCDVTLRAPILHLCDDRAFGDVYDHDLEIDADLNAISFLFSFCVFRFAFFLTPPVIRRVRTFYDGFHYD